MISLSLAQENIPYFTLEIKGTLEEQRFLNGIGITPESLVTIIKNDMQSQNPVLIEIQNSQFMIGRDLSKEIFISPALDHQEVIFKGNKTKQREIILQIIQKFSSHFSLRECVNAVQKKEKKIGEITVYRAIKILREKKIIEEIELPDGSKKFELIKGHHDHIFCQNCGNIIEFHNNEIEKLQENIAKENNVTMISHTMTIIASSCSKCIET